MCVCLCLAEPCPYGYDADIMILYWCKVGTVEEFMFKEGVRDILDKLDHDLVGLVPVKRRVREIAALLVLDKVRLRSKANILLVRKYYNNTNVVGKTRRYPHIICSAAKNVSCC